MIGYSDYFLGSCDAVFAGHTVKHNIRPITYS